MQPGPPWLAIERNPEDFYSPASLPVPLKMPDTMTLEDLLKLAEQLSNIPPESDGHFHFFSKEIIDKNIQARCVDEEEARRAGEELMEVDSDSDDQGTAQSPMLVDGEFDSPEPSQEDPMSLQSVESLLNSLTVSAVTTAPHSPFADSSPSTATLAEAQSLHALSNDWSSTGEAAQFSHALSANTPELPATDDAALSPHPPFINPSISFPDRLMSIELQAQSTTHSQPNILPATDDVAQSSHPLFTDSSIPSANPFMSIDLPAQSTTHSQPNLPADSYPFAAIDAAAQSSTASSTSDPAIDLMISYLHSLFTSPPDPISQVMFTMSPDSSLLPANIETALTNLSLPAASIAEAHSPHALSTHLSFPTARSPLTLSPSLTANEMAQSSCPLSTNLFASSIDPYPSEAINTAAQSSTALTDSYPAIDSTVSYSHTDTSLPMPGNSISQYISTKLDNSSVPGNIQTAQSYLH